LERHAFLGQLDKVFFGQDDLILDDSCQTGRKSGLRKDKNINDSEAQQVYRGVGSLCWSDELERGFAGISGEVAGGGRAICCGRRIA
jgi:hypothetical protein